MDIFKSFFEQIISKAGSGRKKGPKAQFFGFGTKTEKDLSKKDSRKGEENLVSK